jgi:hypothetical protein
VHQYRCALHTEALRFDCRLSPAAITNCSFITAGFPLPLDVTHFKLPRRQSIQNTTKLHVNCTTYHCVTELTDRFTASAQTFDLVHFCTSSRFPGLFQHSGLSRGPILFLPQQVPAFNSRGATHHTDAVELYQRRWELPPNFASGSEFYKNPAGIFYMPQSWVMGHIILLPLRKKAY